MAVPSSPLLLNSSLSSPSSFILSRFGVRPGPKFISRSISNALQPTTNDTDIVIVGAGIAGLATAVSLHRLGVGSLVLEQAESLPTGGTSLTLFKNGWRVLDAIGVGDELRTQYTEIQGMTIRTEEGRQLRSFRFKDADPSQEVRAVERRTLLESLANQLPSDSIRFSSRLETIESNEEGQSLLKLDNGTQLTAKIVIGCDGVRSPIAKWMGHFDAKYVGYCAFRGLASYPQGHPCEPKVNNIYGKGLRAGFVPVSSTKVYWFICFNTPSPGPKVIDPVVLKKQAKALVENWATELLDIIDVTPDDTIIRTPLVDRWLWPLISPPASKDGVVLVGDAWHPMTPNLGQGACCALEDAVVLAKKLVCGINGEPGSLERALRSYEKERWSRIFPLTIRANLVGSLLQWENPVVCAVRNNVVIPKVVKLGPLLEHTNFELEPLLETKV